MPQVIFLCFESIPWRCIFEFGLSNNYAVAQAPILQDRTFQVSLKGYHDLRNQTLSLYQEKQLNYSVRRPY
jgi:hypothetical protein